MKLSPSQKAALKHFKKQESPFQQMHLDAFGVMKVCASWPFMGLMMEYDKNAAPADDYEKWAWLWSRCKFSTLELAGLTGLREHSLFAIEAAIGHRLIYPDGTICQAADQKLKLPFMTKDDKIKAGLYEETISDIMRFNNE